MAARIGDQMGGMAVVEISGGKVETIINLMASRGVLVQHVQKRNGCAVLHLRRSALESVQALAEERGFSVRIVREYGAPMVKRSLRRHMALAAGLILTVALLYAGSSFVWMVEVEGNEKIDTEQILRAARSAGFYEGVFRGRFQRLEVERALLQKIPELAYAEIQLDGIRAQIQVVEKVMAAKGDIQGPCDIIARCDGVIEEMMVQEGQALVKKGDAVTKGQLLISGLLPPKERYGGEEMEAEETETEMPARKKPEPKLVRARGIIQARVWYEGYGECPVWKEERVVSGEETSRVDVCFPWGSWKVSGAESNPYTEGRETKEAHLLHTPWGVVGWKKTGWQEETLTVKQYTREEALRYARKQAEEAILKAQGWEKSPDEVQFRVVSQPSDTVVRVRAMVETVEEIAETRARKNFTE